MKYNHKHCVIPHIIIGVIAHPLDRFLPLDFPVSKRLSTPKQPVSGQLWTRSLQRHPSQLTFFFLLWSIQSFESRPGGYAMTPMTTRYLVGENPTRNPPAL